MRLSNKPAADAGSDTAASAEPGKLSYISKMASTIRAPAYATLKTLLTAPAMLL